MMGFLPGFPYMGGLPAELELPRRENPRLRVPSGSVAIAMAMTIVYSLESPGGWHLLGRTPVPLWDPRRAEPTLLAAGDKVTVQPRLAARVRVDPRASRGRHLRAAPARRGPRMTAALRVISPGLMTTLQDLGRPGYQRLGIPVSGALDPISLRAANLIVGNPAATAALEIAYQGPMLAVEADSVRVALAGASAPVDILDESGAAQRVPPLHSVRLQRGQRLRIGALAAARLPISRSRVASPSSRCWAAGRPTCAPASAASQAAPSRPAISCRLPGIPPPSARSGCCPPSILQRPRASASCLARRTTTSPKPPSARCWKRPTPCRPPPTAWACGSTARRLEHAKGFNIVSDGIAPGAIQVPGNGLPIVLLADRQTTGGYPKVATVISADLPALGRLMPGAKVAFQAVSIDEAEAARRQMAALIADLEASVTAARHEGIIDETKLMAANLVSGVVDARD